MEGKCCQCGTDAMYEFHGHLLCLDCNAKRIKVSNDTNLQLMTMMNFLSDLMQSSLGLGYGHPRIQIPQPIHQNFPIDNLNNIHIDKSVIGTINTGDFVTINSNLDNIHLQVSEELAEQLKAFTNELVNDKQIDAKLKNQISELLSFITTHLLEKPTKKNIVLPLLKNILESVAGINSLFTLCEKIIVLVDSLE